MLFSIVAFGMVSLPACRMDQPTREESNSWVKKRGSGVGVGSSVGVGSGVLVAGIGVGEAGSVAVGEGSASGVVVAVWGAQAEARKISPRRRCFFIVSNDN